MAKERAIELIDQAQEMINKERVPTSEGAQSFLDDVKAWEKACGSFLLGLGPNATIDIPKNQQRGINLAAKDLHIGRRFHVLLNQVYTRSETFLSRMNDVNVDHDKERTDLESFLVRCDKFIKDLKESTRFEEFEGRRPDDAAEMERKMEEAVSNLRHTLLITPSILDEFADTPGEVMYKSINTMTRLLEFENHPSIDQIKDKRKALSRMSYEEDSSENDDERDSKFSEVQRDLLKALLGVDGSKISGDKALSLRYERILKKLHEPSNNTMENQNHIAGQVIRLHERILDKRINDALSAMRTLLDKSDRKNEGPHVKEFRKLFKEVEQDHKKLKDTSIDYKMADLSVLEGGLKNLKRLMSEPKKPEQPRSWTQSKRPEKLRESGNIESQPQKPVTNKPMMGSRGQKKENLPEDSEVTSRESRGPSDRGSSRS